MINIYDSSFLESVYNYIGESYNRISALECQDNITSLLQNSKAIEKDEIHLPAFIGRCITSGVDSCYLYNDRLFEGELIKLSDIQDMTVDCKCIGDILNAKDIYTYLSMNQYDLDGFCEPFDLMTVLFKRYDKQRILFSPFKDKTELPPKLTIGGGQVCNWMLPLMNSGLIDFKIKIVRNKISTKVIRAIGSGEVDTSTILQRINGEFNKPESKRSMLCFYEKLLGAGMSSYIIDFLSTLNTINYLLDGDYLINSKYTELLAEYIKKLDNCMAISRVINIDDVVWIHNDDKRNFIELQKWLLLMTKFITKCKLFIDGTNSFGKTAVSDLKAYAMFLKVQTNYSYKEPSNCDVKTALDKLENLQTGCS